MDKGDREKSILNDSSATNSSYRANEIVVENNFSSFLRIFWGALIAIILFLAGTDVMETTEREWASSGGFDSISNNSVLASYNMYDDNSMLICGITIIVFTIIAIICYFVAIYKKSSAMLYTATTLSALSVFVLIITIILKMLTSDSSSDSGSGGGLYYGSSVSTSITGAAWFIILPLGFTASSLLSLSVKQHKQNNS